MMFLKGAWHGVKVLGAAGYWLMTVYYVWAALILMGRDWRPAAAILLMVAALLPLRAVVARRLKVPGASDIAAFVVYMIVFVVMYSRTQTP